MLAEVPLKPRASSPAPLLFSAPAKPTSAAEAGKELADDSENLLSLSAISMAAATAAAAAAAGGTSFVCELRERKFMVIFTTTTSSSSHKQKQQKESQKLGPKTPITHVRHY
jgi:hypothetical protein